MNPLTKRQKLVNEQRRRQRQQIFKKHRNMYLKEQQLNNMLPSNTSQSDSHQNQYQIDKNNQKNNNNQLCNLSYNYEDNSSKNIYYKQINQAQKRQVQKQTSEQYEFIYRNQFLCLQLLPSQTSYSQLTDSVSTKSKTDQLQIILFCMSKWLAKLSQVSFEMLTLDCLSNARQIVNKFLPVCLFYLRKRILVYAATSCLVQLTGLKNQQLEQLGVIEDQLMSQFIGVIYAIVREATNMQIIFNCVYICGNLHKSFAQSNISIHQQNIEVQNKIIYQETSKGDRSRKDDVQQLQLTIISIMQGICSKYPQYQGCIQILLWYCRNCLIVDRNTRERNKNKETATSLSLEMPANKTNFQVYIANISYRCIYSLCGKINNKQSNMYNDRNKNNQIKNQSQPGFMNQSRELQQNIFRYYLSMIKSAFKIMYILLSEPQSYFNYYIKQKKDQYCQNHVISKKQQNKKKEIVPTTFIQDLLKISNQAFQVFLASYQAVLTHCFSINQSQHNELKYFVGDILVIMCETMSEIIFYVTSMPSYQNLVPHVIINFSISVSQANLQLPEAIQVLSKVMQMCIHSNFQKPKKEMLRNFFSKVQKIFTRQSIVANRDYRVKLFQFISFLQDQITHGELKNLLTKEVFMVRDNYTDKSQKQGDNIYLTMQEQKNESGINKIRNQKSEQQKKYQLLMLSHVIPPILNIIQLLLIDEQAQNRALGLRIVLKFTTNWEVFVPEMRKLLMNMNLNNKVLDMEAEKQEQVYNAALDVIQQLKLDQDADLYC